MDPSLLIREPEKKVKSIVHKLTHSGETDLDKQLLSELKSICKASKDDLVIIVYKKLLKCLAKEHSQVRVATVKLIDYLFQKSHVIREQLLDEFDLFLELTLAITQSSTKSLELPPPKKFAELLQELAAKMIYKWHSDFGDGYEKLRYTYKFLREHQLVDFAHFRVQTHEEIIKQRRLAEQQERILFRSIENRLKEYRELKPEMEELMAQIDSLISILIAGSDFMFSDSREQTMSNEESGQLDTHRQHQQRHGISTLGMSIEISFDPYIEIEKNEENKEIVENLRELKKQLVECKMIALTSIEKTLIKRSDELLTTIRDIVDLKQKATGLIIKLGELRIMTESEKGTKRSATTLDDANSASGSEDDFEEVTPKDDLETYIPKNLRYEYGLEPIDPKELKRTNNLLLVDGPFDQEAGCSSVEAKTDTVALSCNVRMESGKLCSRRDKIKCPFHGKIIPRDHLGVPLDETERKREEEREKRKITNVPDWQEPSLLMEIKAATGIDLTMPKRGKTRIVPKSKLANPKICDQTPKQRLQKKLRALNR